MKQYSAWHFVLLVVAGALVPACAPILPRQAVFNEADFARTRGTGSGAVVGQAFTILKNGSWRVAQNDSVDLAPVNAYTTEIINRKFVKGEKLTPADPRYFKYVRSASTDGVGHFEFHHLPPGDYYVATIVSWPDSYYTTNDDGSTQEQSTTETQHIYRRVSVKNGTPIKVTDWGQGD